MVRIIFQKKNRALWSKNLSGVAPTISHYSCYKTNISNIFQDDSSTRTSIIEFQKSGFKMQELPHIWYVDWRDAPSAEADQNNSNADSLKINQNDFHTMSHFCHILFSCYLPARKGKAILKPLLPVYRHEAKRESAINYKFAGIQKRCSFSHEHFLNFFRLSQI